CDRDISRSDIARALPDAFGGQYLVPFVLTGPPETPCSDLPRVARDDYHVRALLDLVEAGYFQLVDSAFDYQSTSRAGTHCAAIATAKGMQHDWREEHFFKDGAPARQATAEVGPIR